MYLCLVELLKNVPNEICCHLGDKASKGRLSGRDKFQNHTNEGKEKKKRALRRKKRAEKRKNMVALLVFIKANMEFLAEKKLLDLAEQVHFSCGSGFKNPARCMYVSLIVCKTYERQIH